MDTISSSYTTDHRQCDELFLAVEQSLAGGDWAETESAANGFIEAMDGHFAAEEERLFPTLTATAPQAEGPVHVMRMEHEQMRSLFAQLRAAVQARHADACESVAETLLMIMQQHNMKEERILYPMADQALGEQASDLAR